MAIDTCQGRCRLWPESNPMSVSKAFVLILLGLATGLGRGQYLEPPIYLPDSLSGVVEPHRYAYNPNNDKLYVNGYWQGTIVILACSTGQRVGKVVLPVRAFDMVHNPVENKLYCPSPDTLFVLDGATDRIVSRIALSRVRALCYSPCGNKLYAAVAESMLAVIDCHSDTISAFLQIGRSVSLFCYASSASRLYCVCANPNQGIAVLDCVTDSVVRDFAFPGLGSCATGICANSDGTKVYFTAYKDSVIVFDVVGDSVRTRVSIGEVPYGPPCYNPVSNKLYVATFGYRVLIVDAGADTVRAVIGNYVSERFCFASATKVVYGLGSITGVRLIDGAGDSILLDLPLSTRPTELCYSTVSDRVFAIKDTSHSVTIIRRDSVLGSVIIGAMVQDVCYNPIEDRLFVADADLPQMYVVDCATNRPVGSFAVPDVPEYSRSLCFNPASNTIYCIGRHNMVYVVDCQAESAVARLDIDRIPYALCYNPRQQRMYCSDSGAGEVLVFDAVTHERISTIPVGRAASALAYNRERNVLYCGCSDSAIVVIDCSRDSVIGRMWWGQGRPWHMKYYEARHRLYAVLDAINVYDGLADTLVTMGAPRSGFFCDIEISAQSDKAYVADGYYGRLLVIDGATDTVTAAMPMPGGSWGADLGYDAGNDRVYYYGITRGSVAIVDCATDSIRVIFESAGADDPEWCPPHGRMYSSTWTGGSLAVIRDSVVPAVADARLARARRVPCASLIRANEPLFVRGRSAKLYDAAGRVALVLQSGPNDISRLRTGVYWLPETSGGDRHRFVVLR